ncbi:MAG TPA: hypothetical protein VLH61_00020 [Bacteroidales bacterium]|nr:hypothetical protein [Bacteroidales bacterium]
MNEPKWHKLMHRVVEASAGNNTNFLLNSFGHFLLGASYSLELIPFHLVGLILGVVIPGIWIFCFYRLLKESSEKSVSFYFPEWIKKEPLNSILIIFDVAFLMLIWMLIAGGQLDKIWIKVFLTIFMPIIILSLLRNLVKNSVGSGKEDN